MIGIRVVRSGWAIALAAGAAALMAGVSGAAPASATAPVRLGAGTASCDDWQPFRLGIQPPESGTLVIACGSLLLTRISLENVSNTVLRVQLPSQTTEWRIFNPLAITLGTEAALAAVPGVCFRSTLVCNVPSGSKLYAAGSSAMALRFSVGYENTIKANSARFLGQWIQGRLTSPGRQLLGKVVACATDVQNLAPRGSGRTWEDGLRLAITSYAACSDLVKTVTANRVTTPAQRAPVARQVVRLGKAFAGGSWVDQLAYLAARVFRR
jgi:hypothetical protein